MKNSEWQRKLAESRKVERAILKWYQENIDKKARLPTRHQKGYDIISKKVGNVEIKEDRLAHQTGYYAIEFRDTRGEPSGITATTANEFVLVDAENVIIIATVSLAYLIKECIAKRRVWMGYATKDGRQAEGWLIPRSLLLYSSYAKVLERWF